MGIDPMNNISNNNKNTLCNYIISTHASECAEAWLEGMTRCFALRDYASTSKAKISIFQLRDSALNWWGNLERQLHLTPDIVSWELFEERF
jgi:hypothetical protein